MSEQIGLDYPVNPEGHKFRVSTIRTVGGGARENIETLCPFRESDYETYTTWPFETMVFAEASSKGLFHKAYETKEEAIAGHAQAVSDIKAGNEFPGDTVEGPFGTPTLTPEMWKERVGKKAMYE